VQIFYLHELLINIHAIEDSRISFAELPSVGSRISFAELPSVGSRIQDSKITG